MTIDKEGIAYSKFYCDVCQEPIEDLADGNTVFKPDNPGDTLHVHRYCEDRGRTQDRGYDNYQKLEHDVIYLLRNYGWLTPGGNVKAKMKEAARSAEVFNRF
jgi:hypothetical protein